MIKKYSILPYIFILVILALVSLCIGRYGLKIGEIFSILFGNGANWQEVNLLVNIRLPRVLLVIFSIIRYGFSEYIPKSINISRCARGKLWVFTRCSYRNSIFISITVYDTRIIFYIWYMFSYIFIDFI